ncbi:MAG: hypothetical protein M5U26_17640 [Planctomycetota bacterium]|nr:hypothetical protein [Planctomycetota bacterium]
MPYLTEAQFGIEALFVPLGIWNLFGILVFEPLVFRRAASSQVFHGLALRHGIQRAPW